jgi:hypothetical protein
MGFKSSMAIKRILGLLLFCANSVDDTPKENRTIIKDVLSELNFICLFFSL